MAQLEPELVFYAKLVDINDLLKAPTMIKQAQYEKKGDGIRTRIREEIFTDGRATYTFTVKAGERSAPIEQNLPTTHAMFVAFKDWARDRGMVKHRFVFPVDNVGYMVDGVPAQLQWEVDAFPNPETGYEPWVKIDLEFKTNKAGHVVVPDGIPELPIPFARVIAGSSESEIDQAVIRRLYDLYFLSK